MSSLSRVFSALFDREPHQELPPPYAWPAGQPPPSLNQGDLPRALPTTARPDLPRGYTIESGPELIIRRRWFRAVHLFMILFLVFWFGFLIVWYTQLESARRASEGAITAFMIPFYVVPIVHVLAGLFLAYYTLCGLVNTTTIHVERGGQLSIRHFPLPWWPAPVLRVDQIDQIYCTVKVRSDKGGVTRTFQILARLRDGTAASLFWGLDTLDQARWIEHQIEHYLGLTDRPVPGDVDSTGLDEKS